VSYNPDLRAWAQHPLPSDASATERQSHRDFNDLIRRTETLSVTRGRFSIGRTTMLLSAACLFGAGFVTAIWIAALIRS
jgi:hypothetical protein